MSTTIDVDLYGAVASQNAGEHGNALLSEGIGSSANAHFGRRIGGRNLRPPILELFFVKLEHKIERKP